MKILLILLITLSSAFAGNQSRIANAVVSEIKTISSDHCALFPDLEAECLKDFKEQVKKKIKSLNLMMINEKFAAAKIEEKGKIRYESLLAGESISYGEGLSSKQMKELYKSTLKERSCVNSSKEYLDSVSISYSANDTCLILQPIVQEKQCVDSLRLYLTDVSVVYAPENTCVDLMILQEDYISQL